MKKISLAICLLFLNTALFAQKGLHLGFRAMPQSTWMMNQTDSDMSKDTFAYLKTWGMAAGVGIGYGFNNNMGLHVDVLYSTQGQDHESKNSLNEKVRNILRMYYLKVPVLFKINTNGENKYSWCAELGPQVSYLLGVKERNNDRTYHPEEVPFIYKTNVPTRKETFKPITFGATVRLGLDVKLRYNLRINTRIWVDNTFSDVENKEASYDLTYQGITTDTPWYAKNRAKTMNLNGGFSVGLTYLFLPKVHY